MQKRQRDRQPIRKGGEIDGQKEDEMEAGTIAPRYARSKRPEKHEKGRVLRTMTRPHLAELSPLPPYSLYTNHRASRSDALDRTPVRASDCPCPLGVVAVVSFLTPALAVSGYKGLSSCRAACTWVLLFPQLSHFSLLQFQGVHSSATIQPLVLSDTRIQALIGA